MTKADLYKRRRSKNKQRKSSSDAEGALEREDNQETSLLLTINNLKSRMNKNSIEHDVELIRANTQDTPLTEKDTPTYETDEIPALKPVQKTYAKSRSKLDDYIYIESSQGLDETEVAFPKGSRIKKKETQSPPAKRRRIETRQSKKLNGDAEKPPTPKRGRGRPKKSEPEKRVLRSRTIEITRATNESIENDKNTKVTRKRKRDEKPVLREKGQNGHSRISEEKTRKIVRAKRELPQINIEDNVRMTRSRRRRMAISLSPSQVKSLVPADSFESDRGESVNTKAKKKTQRKAKKTPVRTTRSTTRR